MKRGHRGYGPQASEGEAQHELFCWTGRFGQGDERLDERSHDWEEETDSPIKKPTIEKDAPPCLSFLTKKAPYKGFGADSGEKHEPASDIDTSAVDSPKALDPNRPIREADILSRCNICSGNSPVFGEYRALLCGRIVKAAAVMPQLLF